MFIDQPRMLADTYLGFIMLWDQVCIGSVVQGEVVFKLFCWGT